MQIILTTPANPDLHSFSRELQSTLETGLVSVLLIKKAQLDLPDYKELVEQVRPIAQTYDCAVLLDNEPKLVHALNADGVQISTSHADVLEALNLLKPEYIVGAANINSRHQAMLCGEAGVDYLAFGDFTNSPDEDAMALSKWWAELFEVPCAVFDPTTKTNRIEFGAWEFQGLGENLWNGATPAAKALKSLSARQQKN